MIGFFYFICQQNNNVRESLIFFFFLIKKENKKNQALQDEPVRKGLQIERPAFANKMLNPFK